MILPEPPAPAAAPKVRLAVVFSRQAPLSNLPQLPPNTILMSTPSLIQRRLSHVVHTPTTLTDACASLPRACAADSPETGGKGRGPGSSQGRSSQRAREAGRGRIRLCHPGRPIPFVCICIVLRGNQACPLQRLQQRPQEDTNSRHPTPVEPAGPGPTSRPQFCATGANISPCPTLHSN